ncbi:MAG: hypothetical protein EZS28_009136 [Streblomastix strix]|uniref:B30.2/SPRY domain-containing protein n=1 Tax=Streblomastix strix TaxID=222440 RepID=A0A5J4WLS4_9EUKA|nr:MAG: hypothetical protein EZS28_009136 [Streblomastix strix]
MKVAEKEHRRQETEIQLLKEKEEREALQLKVEKAEKQILELSEKLRNSQNFLKIKTEDLKIVKQKSENEEIKTLEEQEKRIDAEKEKGRIEGENLLLKEQINRFQTQISRLKEKYGEVNFDEQIKPIENNEAERDKTSRKAKEEIGKEKLEKEPGRFENQRGKSFALVKGQSQTLEEGKESVTQLNVRDKYLKGKQTRKSFTSFEKLITNQKDNDNDKNSPQKISDKQEIEKERRKRNDVTEHAQVLEGNKLEDNLQDQKKGSANMHQNDELIKIKEKLSNFKMNFPISILNQDSEEIDFISIDEYQRKIIKKSIKNSIISLSRVFESGIWSMEVQFSVAESNWIAVGIVQDSYTIPPNSRPDLSPHQEHMAIYTGSAWTKNVMCKGINIVGNAPIESQIVKAELNFGKGTLSFFLNDLQQPVYISGINEKVRFIIYLFTVGATCSILSLKKIATPAAENMQNEKGVNW